MKKIYTLATIAVALIASLVTSCSEDTSGMNTAPEITELDAKSIFRTGAILYSKVSNPDNRKIQESGFIVSTSNDFENLTMDEIRNSSSCTVLSVEEEGNNDPVEELSMSVTKLTSKTTYYYCAFISSGYSVLRSQTKSFTTTTNNNPTFSPVVVTDVSLNSATLTCELLDIGSDDDQMAETLLEFKTVGANEVISNPATVTSHQQEDITSGQVTLNDLQQNTRYAAWVHGTTTTGLEGYSDVIYFTTASFSASFSASTLSSSGSTMTLSTSISTSEQVVSKGICYSQENTNPDKNNYVQRDESTGTGINVTVTKLPNGTSLPDGLYYVRPYVCIQKESQLFYVYGETKDITVHNGALPQLSQVTVTDSTSNSLTVSAKLQTDGGVKPTEYGFCYIEEGKGTPTVDNGITPVFSLRVNADGTFTAKISELSDNTYYTIRAFAKNSNGIGYGDPITVRTKKLSPSQGEIVFPE